VSLRARAKYKGLKMPQITVQNLTKTFHIPRRQPGLWGSFKGLLRRDYTHVKALDAVSFTIDEGELLGYIGPNGAGKSTTVKILSGILVPDSGTVSVMGRTPWKNRIPHVRDIGVVFGQRTQLWWDLPTLESFDLLRDIYSVPKNQYARTRDELIALLDLEKFLDTPVRQLSLGQRMRCDLAAALLHSPKLLFLDEPTIGLDAVSKLAVRDFIARLNRERNVTVILTTHDMDDIEALCRRVLVIGDGKILSDGTLADLRARVSRHRWLTVDLTEDTPYQADPDITLITHTPHRLHLAFDPQHLPTPAAISRVAQTYPVRDLFVENPPIESIIARMYADRRPTEETLVRS
jgi:ABC-2 type transport system ATP-binding protein